MECPGEEAAAGTESYVRGRRKDRTMPLADKDQESWRLKAIGREKRWTSFFETLVNVTNGGTAGMVDALRQKLPQDAANAVRNADFQSAPVDVMGKRFRPGYIRTGLLRSGMQKVTGGIVNLSLGWGLNKGAKALSEKEVVDNLYQLTTVDVKWQLARKDVYIDEEKVAALESATGYRFDTLAFYEKMRNAIDQCGDRFYDNTWRNELMPHILKNLFMEETKKMYRTLAEQAQGEGILSEELLDQTLANGTRMMQDIMESYTRDLANKTPLLGAPIRFVKEEKDPLAEDTEPLGMTDKEKERWKNLKSDLRSSDATYLTTESQLRRMRGDALGFIRDSKAEDVEKMFSSRFGEKGIRKAENGKAGTQIDSVEAAAAILEVRELKKRNQKRGFFNRIFHWTENKKEKEAIGRMTAKLNEVFPAGEVEARLNDQNYASGYDAKYTAKNVFHLRDAKPRDISAQRSSDFWNAAFDWTKQIGKGVFIGLKVSADYAYQAGAGMIRGMLNVINGKKALENPEEKKEEAPEKDGREKNAPGKDPKAAEDAKQKESGKQKESEKPVEAGEKKEEQKKDPYELDFDDDDMEAIFGEVRKVPENNTEQKKENEAGGVPDGKNAEEEQKQQSGWVPNWVKNTVSSVGSVAYNAGAGIYNTGSAAVNGAVNMGGKVIGVIQNQFDVVGDIKLDDLDLEPGGGQPGKAQEENAPKEQDKDAKSEISKYEDAQSKISGGENEDAQSKSSESEYEDAKSKMSDDFGSVKSDLEERMPGEKAVEEREFSLEELMKKYEEPENAHAGMHSGQKGNAHRESAHEHLNGKNGPEPPVMSGPGRK